MKISKIILATCLFAALSSCDNSSKDNTITVNGGTYILNNGNWGSNDSNIGIYSPSAKTFAADAL